jgi:hypothetical protein
LIDLLGHGQIEMRGEVPWSSNYTFLVMIRQGQQEVLAVYKPCRGEQPLWDFPSRTLCRREVASYLLSRSLGWPRIPPVVLRSGPLGLGSVQAYVDVDLEEHYFTLRERPECSTALRQIVLFDAIANNADRKGGHVLRSSDGEIWAIDHGLTFHVEHKLRTVIWEYAGERIDPNMLHDLDHLAALLAARDSALCRSLGKLLAQDEVTATRSRLNGLVRGGVFPLPRQGRRNVPYPLV